MSIFTATGFAPLANTRRTGLVTRVFRALSLVKQRQDLSRLDPHALRDIGMTKSEAEAEASRPIWDAPRHFYK